MNIAHFILPKLENNNLFLFEFGYHHFSARVWEIKLYCFCWNLDFWAEGWAC